LLRQADIAWCHATLQVGAVCEYGPDNLSLSLGD
jgi:hypothetical protein